MVRALFLGSGGRIGTLLRAAWASDIDPIWHDRTKFDIISDDAALKSAIINCDVIVNLAGATHHGSSEVGSANTDLAKRVLDNADGKPVFLMSSAAVYGTKGGILSETSELAPISTYAKDKATMEAMAQDHTTRSITLRLGNVAGADALLGVTRERYILDAFEDGTYPCRSYIGPRQLAAVIATLITNHRSLPDVLNIATSQAVSMGDLLRAAGKPWDSKPAGPDAIAKVELDTRVLEQFVTLPENAHLAKTIVADWKSL